MKGELQPTFTLNGTDVTSSIGNYGITLGTDVAGEFSSAAFNGGGGIVIPYGSWYLDFGVRFLTFTDNGERTNASRFVVGGGFRF